MKKIISFSLWGSNPKYCIGALKNAILAKKIYPGWICRYYLSKSVPVEIQNQLVKLNNCEIVYMEDEGNWTGMFWRFIPAFEDEDNIVIIRDVDSRLNLREKAAVDDWLSSSMDFHIMRDHPLHNISILGGMWGVRRRLLLSLKKDFFSFKKENYWQIDQKFLESVVYPVVSSNCLVHDEFFERKIFPIQRQGDKFVGEVYNEYEESDTDGQIALKNYYKKNVLEKFFLRNKFLIKKALRKNFYKVKRIF